ncbi:hypothetical protein CONPUDRAFT_142199 [Coniophora puteana RWD-64-598 SS2]|uniref:Acid protease n=1 Tax=Coniophora puteana (strain RWD-64-598) TaxID=741705 RepID=A0A5M3N396_CONPW|nr:uncharacterized protein CONPUDRAFT_142199 [Coniophora puteana RWD-64-598 SS2]EIW85796.1 hypothetical protein CONPUDRAFT_142199 [Coniophora puteana RWD-64-598 SS2]
MQLNTRLLSLSAFILLAQHTYAQTPSGETIPYTDLFPNADPQGATNCTLQLVTSATDVTDPDAGEDGGVGSSTFDGTADGSDPNSQSFAEVVIDSPNESSVSSMNPQSDWRVVGCNTHSDQPQNVLAYCSKAMDDPKSGCGHVFLGKAEHTIVAMPAECGLGPYARVSKLEPHPDQSLAKQFAGEDKPENEPMYHFAFDYEFTDIPEDNGPVYMRIDASNMMDFWDNIVESPPERRQWLEERGLWEDKPSKRGLWDTFTSWVKKTTTITSQKGGGNTYKWDDKFNLTKLYTKDVGSGGSRDLVLTLSSLVSGSFDFEIDAHASLSAKYGYYVQGSVIPPAIDKAYLYFTSNAHADAGILIKGEAKASYKSQRLQVANLGFPGLYYPGLITIGPALNIEAYLAGSLTLSGKFETRLTIDLPLANFAFGKQGDDQDPQPITTIAGPSAPTVSQDVNIQFGLQGDLSVHLVPQLQFGIKLLGGKLLDAQSFIGVDVGGGITLDAGVGTGTSPHACITPYIDILFEAGLRGSVLYWKPKPASYKIFQEKYPFDSVKQCLGNTSKRDMLDNFGVEDVDEFLALDEIPYKVIDARNTDFMDDTSFDTVPALGSGFDAKPSRVYRNMIVSA